MYGTFCYKKGSELIKLLVRNRSLQHRLLSDAGATASDESSDFMVDNNQLPMLAVCV